jgi:acyl transferase domain-containing protein/NAD(P)-dependent dehydrogenase (short-subunit alcohol dehydrogenase family)/acyl carrier protein
MKDTTHRAVAVVGIGAILPDAPDVATFWHNLKEGRYSISDVDPARWDPDLYYDADPQAVDKSYSKIGGWVRDWQWDPRAWRLPIPPAVSDAMDDGQRWAINCTQAALADYGWPDRKFDPDRCAVILGNAMAGEKHYRTALRVYFPEFARELEQAESFAALAPDVREAVIAQTRERFRHTIPDITEDTMPGELANCIAGRIANLFNFNGPNYVVDAACASAMAAMTAAIEGLEEDDFDTVITGGMDRNMGASSYVKFCKIGALSATGTRPYADGADGFVMGEGASLFILRRLEDAERDGDRIYAVLRAIGGSSDGRGKGITAPNPKGQKLAIQRAWENAGLSPDTATYVEGHGTSTRVGDVVEVESLASVFASAGAAPQSIGLGSVKSNIGHLKGAAGAAGLLKTILSLHDKVLPPNINYTAPNPNIDFAHSPFRVVDELRDWEKPACGVRRAGVSAFGFGGTNFHAVLEEHVPGMLTRGSRRFVQGVELARANAAVDASQGALKAPIRGAALLGADSPAALMERLRALHADAQASRSPAAEAPLRSDLEAPERLAIDFADPGELARKCALAMKAMEREDPTFWGSLSAQGVFRGRGKPGKVAFLYPGQGSQYPNMLAQLRAHEATVRAVFDQADRVMEPLLGKPLSEVIFTDPDDEAAVKAAAEALRQTAITQPAVLTVDAALTAMLNDYGVAPDMVMGHSLGEYGALTAAGALDFGDALEAVSARGREMTRVSVEDTGKMAAVFAPLADVQRELAGVDGYVVVANVNSHTQAVIGGSTPGMEAAIERLTAAGMDVRPLPVSHAFHTRIVAPASEPLRNALTRLRLKAPRIPTISNVTGEFYPQHVDDMEPLLDLLVRQIASPVQFVKGLETLYDAGARVFVEVGPKKALTGFVDDVLRPRGDVVSLFTNHPKVGEEPSFNQALCGLYAAGCGRGRDDRPVVSTISTTTEAPNQATATMPRAGASAHAPSVGAVAAATPALTAPAPPRSASGPISEREQALGELFSEFMERGRRLFAGPAPAAQSSGSIVITGAALGLPGTPRLFDDRNLSRILHGEQFIDVVPYRFRQAMLDKQIVRLVKRADGDPTFESIDRVQDVIKLAGRAGAFDPAREFGIKPERTEAFDSTTAMAIGAGIDALRDAGVPLVQHYKTTTTGTQLPDRWALPESMRDDTGVIFASAFPGVDAFAAETEKYYDGHGHREQIGALKSLREWMAAQGDGNDDAISEVDRRIEELASGLERDGFHFDRRYLFRVLSMGHSQFAEEIGARGPNTQVNGACASTPQAIALAEDWIRAGRCRRVIVVSADNVTSDHLMEWIGAGFLATGAAATDEAVEEAALPFDRRRHGMIAGMGAAALVVESEDAARERGIAPICEILGTLTANSAFHGTRLDVDHISQCMEKLITDAERRHGIRREQIAPHTMFMSHETYTPARGGSASAEVHALRSVFGQQADHIVIANTKGFTGHAMGAGVEDVVAVKALETGLVPPVPNYREVDPDLGTLNLSKGGAYPVQYGLRFGAGFGSQLAMTLMRWVSPPDGHHRTPEELGHQYRIADREAWQRFLDEASGQDGADVEIVQHRLRIRDTGAARRRPAPIQPAATAPPPSEAPASAATPDAVAEATAASGEDPVRTRVLALVAEKTGYPEDMLDMDLDLEADLGIDTVKQADLFATVRGEWNIERDPDLKLRDFPTLEHVIGFVYDKRPDLRTQQAAAPVTAPSTAPAPAASANGTPAETAAPAAAPGDDPVRARVLALVAEKTGYPEDMLDMDLDLEADLGIDTVKQADLFATVRGEWDIERDPDLKLRDFPTLQHVIGFVYDKRPDLRPATSGSVATASPSPPAAATAASQATPTAATAATDSTAATATAQAPADDVQQRLLTMVAEKTGYPEDMLELDLDLEADLGIDTVKQADLFATVREAYGIPRDPDLKLREFPTLAHVIQFVHDRRPETAGGAAGGGDDPQRAAEESATAAATTDETVTPATATAPALTGSMEAANAVPRRVPCPVWRPPLAMCKPTAVTLGESSRVVVMPDTHGVAKALTKRLKKRGVQVLALSNPSDRETVEHQLAAWLEDGDIHGVYWLAALDPDAPLDAMTLEDWRAALSVRVKLLHSTMRSLYEQIASPDRFLVAATRLGGQHGYDARGALNPLGGAVSGFAKAFRRERDALVKVVDFDESRKTAALADALIDETLHDTGVVEIGLHEGERWTVGLEDLPAQAVADDAPLGADTVFAVTGAAGSIVSAIVTDLATATAGTFHLLDLAPAPDPADPDIALFANDPEALKRSLFERIKAQGERPTPARIDKELARLERSHAALTALQAIERAGGTGHYHSVDLTDADAVRAVVDTIRDSSGRIDVLLHAAGIEISRFLPDKEAHEFDLVFDVKSDGWFNLMRAIGDMPLGAAVAFSSVAARFGNGGQTDYSAANDLLCKSLSAFRGTRPDTRGIAIDWTAWGGIGMASRGSIPQMMAAAGIDMLPPEAGIAIVRRELTQPVPVGEVVIGDRLGIMMEEWDDSGGLDPAAIDTGGCGPLIGEVRGFGLYSGLVVQTRLDPQEQPFLNDHRIEGTPVLPGVMGLESFAEIARLPFPHWHVAAIEDVSFLEPFKFYRGEPRELTLNAQFRADGDAMVADCELIGVRHLKKQTEPRITRHFVARVRLTRQAPQTPDAASPELAGEAHKVEAGDVYRVYFHGPAFQVLDSAWGDGPGKMVGRMRDPLPQDHVPAERPLTMAPRHVELCLQTAGIYEVGTTGHMRLPYRIRRLVKYREPEPGETMYSVVRERPDHSGFDAEVLDGGGSVYLRLEDYRSAEHPDELDAGVLAPIRAAMVEPA